MAGMDASVFLLILIALVALVGSWRLSRPLSRNPPTHVDPPRTDSYGLSGAVDAGGHAARANWDSGTSGGSDSSPDGN